MIEQYFVHMVYFLSDITFFGEVSSLTVYSPSSFLESGYNYSNQEISNQQTFKPQTNGTCNRFGGT